MIRIIDERGTGKTSRLMLLAKENNAIIVCSNPRAMEYKAKAYGITGLNFISYQDFIIQDNGYDPDGLYLIDELEGLMQVIFFTNKAKWLGYSMSIED